MIICTHRIHKKLSSFKILSKTQKTLLNFSKKRTRNQCFQNNSNDCNNQKKFNCVNSHHHNRSFKSDSHDKPRIFTIFIIKSRISSTLRSRRSIIVFRIKAQLYFIKIGDRPIIFCIYKLMICMINTIKILIHNRNHINISKRFSYRIHIIA